MAETIYEARFVASKKEGRMGIAIDTYCGYFVQKIRGIENRRWQAENKTWFFDTKDYNLVKKFVLDGFQAPLMIVEIDGTVSLHNMSK